MLGVRLRPPTPSTMSRELSCPRFGDEFVRETTAAHPVAIAFERRAPHLMSVAR
jgi:hypothetical protein